MGYFPGSKACLISSWPWLVKYKHYLELKELRILIRYFISVVMNIAKEQHVIMRSLCWSSDCCHKQVVGQPELPGSNKSINWWDFVAANWERRRCLLYSCRRHRYCSRCLFGGIFCQRNDTSLKIGKSSEVRLSPTESCYMFMCVRVRLKKVYVVKSLQWHPTFYIYSFIVGGVCWMRGWNVCNLSVSLQQKYSF